MSIRPGTLVKLAETGQRLASQTLVNNRLSGQIDLGKHTYYIIINNLIQSTHVLIFFRHGLASDTLCGINQSVVLNNALG